MFFIRIKMNFTFYFGSGGTGKTYLLKEMSSHLDCHIFAPTWSVAHKINGTTIYNYCKCPYTRFKPKKFIRDHVFIDEIFMYSKKDM